MNPNTNTTADPKLQHLITKIIKGSDSQKISSKQILDTLLNKHREYRRKNSSNLLACIEILLSDIGKQRGLNATVGASGVVVGRGPARKALIPTGIQISQSSEEESISKKRQREEESDEEFEKQAVQNDLNRIQLSGSSMLNANLRNRYKDVQRERDIATREKAVEEGKDQETLPSVPELGTANGTITPASTPNTKLKKKKKKMSKSSSSNSLFNDEQ